MSYIDKKHREKIEDAFLNFKNIANFSKCFDVEAIKNKNYNLSLPFYIRPLNDIQTSTNLDFKIIEKQWKESITQNKDNFIQLLDLLKESQINE